VKSSPGNNQKKELAVGTQVSFKSLTIRLKSRRLVDRSMSVGRQPGKPGWLATVVNLLAWSTKKSTEWTNGWSVKRQTSGQNKTSRWTMTRRRNNFHASVITYCPPQRHLADCRYDEHNSRNVNNQPIERCNLLHLYNILVSFQPIG